MDPMKFDAREVERRLENWGRWARARKSVKGRSFLLGIMVDRGWQQENAEPEGPFIKSFDELDAVMVDQVWRSIEECPEREYLLERFVFNRSGERALRGVRWERRQTYKDRALRMIFNRLKRLGAGGRMPPTV